MVAFAAIMMIIPFVLLVGLVVAASLAIIGITHEVRARRAEAAEKRAAEREVAPVVTAQVGTSHLAA